MLRENRVVAGSVFLALVGLLLLNSQGYFPFLSDDALISLRYAERLLDGSGLNWTDGQPVEGYSNLLWILSIAAVGLADVDLIRAARVLGVVFSALALGVLLVYALRRKNLRECGWSVAIASVCFASAAPVGVWAIGGLEQPLLLLSLSVLVAGGLSLLRSPADTRGDWFCRGAALALVLTRPDGALLVAAVALALALFARDVVGPRRQLLLWLPAILAIGGQEILRLGYYGDWLPNTARIKLSTGSGHLANGWNYLRWGLRALLPLCLLSLGALALLWRRPSSRPSAALLSAPLLSWCAYVVFIGGDIFPAWRHMLPILLLLLYALVEAQLRDLNVPIFGSSRRAALLVGILTVAGFSFVQQADRENQRARQERWEWFGKQIGLAIRGAFQQEQPLLAVSAAGCIPYWSGLPAVDMLGLNDRHIARRRPERGGEGYLGHEFGDGDYVLGREPDIVCFGVGAAEPGFRSGLELWATERFHDDYQPIRLALTKPDPFTATLFVRKRSERIGARMEGAALRLPAFLFGAESNAEVHPAADGAWELEIDAGSTLELELPADGHWLGQEGNGWKLEAVDGSSRQLLRLRNLTDNPLRFKEFRLAPAEQRG